LVLPARRIHGGGGAREFGLGVTETGDPGGGGGGGGGGRGGGGGGWGRGGGAPPPPPRSPVTGEAVTEDPDAPRTWVR
jgi:hypothetical protein